MEVFTDTYAKQKNFCLDSKYEFWHNNNILTKK